MSPEALKALHAQTQNEAKIAKEEGVQVLGTVIMNDMKEHLVKTQNMDPIQSEIQGAKIAEQTETVVRDQKWNVVLALDRSGSFQDEYEQGLVEAIVTRFSGIATQFDADGDIDVYLFHNGVKKKANLTLKNFETYIQNEFRNEGYGGTSYAVPIRQITQDWKAPSNGLPTFVIFLTDGDNNSDKSGEAEGALTEASNSPIFWFFVGMDSKYRGGGLMDEATVKAKFPVLANLDDIAGRKVDNADSMGLAGHEAFSKSDVMNKMFSEAPRWLMEARSLGIQK